MKKQRKFTRPEWLSFRWMKENIDATIIMLIAFSVSALVFVGWFSSMDWYKATNEDWSQVYKQAEAIRELEKVINDDNISVEITIESKECKLILQKGEDNKLSKIEEYDKAVPFYKAIPLTVSMMVISIILGFIVIFLEVAFYSIAMALWENKLKQKRGT